MMVNINWQNCNLPVFVGIDYHTKTIQVCVMDQQKNILVNQTVVAPFGSNVHAARK
jgi:hypothetical protein